MTCANLHVYDLQIKDGIFLSLFSGYNIYNCNLLYLDLSHY